MQPASCFLLSALALSILALRPVLQTKPLPGFNGPTSPSSDHHSLPHFPTGSLVFGSIALLSFIFSVRLSGQVHTLFQTALHSYTNLIKSLDIRSSRSRGEKERALWALELGGVESIASEPQSLHLNVRMVMTVAPAYATQVCCQRHMKASLLKAFVGNRALHNSEAVFMVSVFSEVVDSTLWLSSATVNAGGTKQI